MLTYYCPSCWTIVQDTDNVCPACGYDLAEFQEHSFEDKLLGALYHAVPERQIMAAQILGNLQSQRAMAEFLKIVDSDEENYFYLRAVLIAAAKIDHPDREIILRKATHHHSDLVARLASELLEQLRQNQDINQWDRHTG